MPITIKRRLLNAVPLLGRHLEPRWLRPTRASADELVRIAEDEICDARRAVPGRPVVLNAMFHNVEIIGDASPYAADEGAARAVLERVRALLKFAERESMRVIGLGDVPEIFRT